MIISVILPTAFFESGFIFTPHKVDVIRLSPPIPRGFPIAGERRVYPADLRPGSQQARSLARDPAMDAALGSYSSCKSQ